MKNISYSFLFLLISYVLSYNYCRFLFICDLVALGLISFSFICDLGFLVSLISKTYALLASNPTAFIIDFYYALGNS